MCSSTQSKTRCKRPSKLLCTLWFDKDLWCDQDVDCHTWQKKETSPWRLLKTCLIARFPKARFRTLKRALSFSCDLSHWLQFRIASQEVPTPSARRMFEPRKQQQCFWNCWNCYSFTEFSQWNYCRGAMSYRSTVGDDHALQHASGDTGQTLRWFHWRINIIWTFLKVCTITK